MQRECQVRAGHRGRWAAAAAEAAEARTACPRTAGTPRTVFISIGLCGAARQASGLARFVWICTAKAHRRLDIHMGEACFGMFGDDGVTRHHEPCMPSAAETPQPRSSRPALQSATAGSAMQQTAVTATCCSRWFVEDELAPTKLHLKCCRVMFPELYGT